MKAILVIIPLASIIFAIINGRMSEVSSAILEKSGDAVTLALSLCGIMCFWCGLMRVAEKAGLVEKAARLLSPAVGFLFKGLRKGGRAAQLVSLNLAANILGLGNATTPLGIRAMRAIAEEKNETEDNGGAESSPPKSGAACDEMIMLVVLNTASLQLIPTTAAALRASHGAENPMDILPCVWIVSAYSLTVTVTAAKIMAAASARRRKKRGG